MRGVYLSPYIVANKFFFYHKKKIYVYFRTIVAY